MLEWNWNQGPGVQPAGVLRLEELGARFAKWPRCPGKPRGRRGGGRLGPAAAEPSLSPSEAPTELSVVSMGFMSQIHK